MSFAIPDLSQFSKTPETTYKKFGDLTPNTVYLCSSIKDVKTKNGDAKRLILNDPKIPDSSFSILVNPDVFAKKMNFHKINSCPFWFYFEAVKTENGQKRNCWEPSSCLAPTFPSIPLSPVCVLPLGRPQGPMMMNMPIAH